MTQQQNFNLAVDNAPVEDAEPTSISPVITLPDYDDMTEQKVMAGVKDVFKGFDHNPIEVASQLKDEKALAAYAERTIDDIKEVRRSTDMQSMRHRAAALARFWYLGLTLDKALSDNEYGVNAANRLAAAMKVSIPYIYQIRAVSTKLTSVDCYLLGMRGLDTTHLRKLSRVKDEQVRHLMLTTFIRDTPDTSDAARLEQARKRFIAAVNTQQNLTAEDLVATDPLNGGSEVHVSPEYQRVMDAVANWQRMLRKPALEGPIEEACAALADFYLTDDIPEAAERLAEVKQACELTRNLVHKVKSNLDDLLRELECMQTVELTSKESEGAAAG